MLTLAALDRKLFRDLWHWWGQSLAIALVVICGIASLVTMLSAYQSLYLTQSAYYREYRFADVFLSLKRAPQSLQAEVEQIPGVNQVRTRVVVDVTLNVPGLQEPATGRLISIPEFPRPMLNDLHLQRGRYLEPGHPEEVVVSETFVQANDLQLGDAFGAVINGRWQELKIVGLALSPEYVYEIRGAGDIFPDNRRFGVIWMEREALATAFDLDGAFNDLSLTLLPGASQAVVIDELDRLFEPYGGLGAYGRQDQISHRFLAEELAGLQGTATLVPAVFLGVAAFLLNILMARLISTQREQIAVLKAFGYTNLSLGIHYLKFAVIIVAIGAVAGTCLGLYMGSGVTRTYAEFYHFPLLRYEASSSLLFIAIAVSAGASLLGTATALHRAVILPPAEAMRPEPPARYRPTLLEQWGLQQSVPVVGRMILRNLERKPLNAFFSMLGIALAISLLIVGRYLVGAAEYLVEVQFEHVQREDVTIVFNEPLSAQARYEVRRLPGVIRSETYRAVPARLHFQHRSYQTALTGLDPEGELRRLIDQQLRQVNLPPEGVVLSQQLARILGVKAGDDLWVEVLEGERPLLRIPVAGLLDDLIGVSAYMDRRALNRLMQEGDTISGAYLSADSQQVQELYQLLKETPAVTGVALRQAVIQSFEDTVATSMGIFTGVLITFAAIITFGVIYNAARIALSERGRELATLRIIGFSQTEVTVILLGEQTLLILMALPVGFGLGYGLSALLTQAYTSELYRLPLIITPEAYMLASGVVAAAAGVSGWMIRQQLNQLDLIAVLKTRE